MMAEKHLQITISQVSPERPDARLVMFDDETMLRLSLEPLKGNLYRLGTTPLTDDGGIYLGDIIEAEIQVDGVLRFLRVVEASPLLHWSWLLPERWSHLLQSRFSGRPSRSKVEYGNAILVVLSLFIFL